MKTEFISLSDKVKIFDQLKKGNVKSIEAVIDEIQRLENIIDDYEIAFRISKEKFESKTYKKPKQYET